MRLTSPFFSTARSLTLSLLVFSVLSCSSKAVKVEEIPEPVVSQPTVVIKRVPEYVSDPQIEMSARDLLALAGIETRPLQITSKNGVLSITGTAESSRALNNALALMNRIKGVRELRADIDGGTVSGMTNAPVEEPSLMLWFVRLFWPILALIGAAFVAIGFLFFQTRIISKQLQKRRQLRQAAQA